MVDLCLQGEMWTLLQVQYFIPLPLTGAAALYVTGLDINTGKPIPVVKGAGDRERQKRMLRPNPVNETRVTGSRRRMASTEFCPGAQMDTVD